jgi:hypothetical protein
MCAGTLLSLSTMSSGSGGDCASAQRDLTQAQQALAKALRDSDTSGEAYATCTAKGGGCGPQKAAYDAACAAKKKAKAAVSAATAARDALCAAP